MKLIRELNSIFVINDTGEKIGNVSIENVKDVLKNENQNNIKIKGFPRRVRILWVNYKNTDEVNYNRFMRK